MRIHRAIATIALTILTAAVLTTSTAFVVTGATAASTAVLADHPDEMGYNGVSPAEMGYD